MTIDDDIIAPILVAISAIIFTIGWVSNATHHHKGFIPIHQINLNLKEIK